jgi:tetratricopeptide (TPR) repeat protein
VKNPHYTAYVSYSHSDARWAGWLHRALEGYRVPSRLVGRQGEHGKIPRRLAPVFRDREDLSSASDLGKRLTEALHSSLFLVVVCSPAAASSRWVNEEIRTFRDQHGPERIFCMLVEGEARGVGPSPFPEELIKGGEKEPLAADPREWADGKTLARQKIIAGMLGIRLDELRQRDRKRRRLWQAGMVTAGLTVSVLAFSIFSSRMAEQQERERAEEMASFIVELGERLRSDLDSESLALMSQQAVSYLESVDQRNLSRETALKVGLAFRQFGLAIGDQGDGSGAIDALMRSKQVLRDLLESNPEDTDVLFELSQSEFYVGNRGEYSKAEEGLRAYLDYSQELLATDPDNPNWILEASYAANGMLALRQVSDEDASAALLKEAESAVKLAQRAMDSWGASPDVVSQFALTAAWAADAYLKACRLDEALEFRETGFPLDKSLAREHPGNLNFQVSLAFRHSGLANLLGVMGRLPTAFEHRNAAVEQLEALTRRDPSNLVFRQHLLKQRALLVMQQSPDRIAEVTLEDITAIDAAVLELYNEAERPATVDLELIRLAYTKADLARKIGAEATARGHLDQLLARIDPHLGQPLTHDMAYWIGASRVLWWELNGKDPAIAHPGFAKIGSPGDGDYRSCVQSDLAARLAVMHGEQERAVREAEYLSARGYREQGFLEFCRRHEVCHL